MTFCLLPRRTSLLLGALCLLSSCSGRQDADRAAANGASTGDASAIDLSAMPADTLRVMTYNLEDVRTDDLLRKDHPRLLAAARVIQKIRPDILFLNEIAYDQPGVPGYADGDEPGQNGTRFAEFVARSAGVGFEPIHYVAFMAPSNTGQASGYDLDHDGQAVTDYPVPPSASDDGTPAAQTPEGRSFGNDTWGFGTFPGQYAMALLVRQDLTIDREFARTFRHFRWRDAADTHPPVDPETRQPWYDEATWNRFPLSSKSHWDVPITLDSGRTLHLLLSHPTPAAFDGQEQRNRLRNRAEIKFWSDYIASTLSADGVASIVDDTGTPGGLEPGARFIIMGDLNADPDEGSAIDDPIGSFLLSNPAINASFTPRADAEGIAAFPRLDSDDTAQWGMRVDYVLPSVDIAILDGMIVRRAEGLNQVSDHFPVYLDVVIDG